MLHSGRNSVLIAEMMVRLCDGNSNDYRCDVLYSAFNCDFVSRVVMCWAVLLSKKHVKKLNVLYSC